MRLLQNRKTDLEGRPIGCPLLWGGLMPVPMPHGIPFFGQWISVDE